MLARFLATYPGYTAEMALQMPWRRFMALVRSIPVVVAEQQLRMLQTMVVAVNPGEKGEAYYGLVEELQHVAVGGAVAGAAGGAVAGASGGERVEGSRSKVEGAEALRPGVNAAVRYEAEEGSIAAEMARQAAAWEEMVRSRQSSVVSSQTEDGRQKAGTTGRME